VPVSRKSDLLHPVYKAKGFPDRKALDNTCIKFD